MGAKVSKRSGTSNVRPKNNDKKKQTNTPQQKPQPLQQQQSPKKKAGQNFLQENWIKIANRGSPNMSLFAQPPKQSPQNATSANSSSSSSNFRVRNVYGDEGLSVQARKGYAPLVLNSLSDGALVLLDELENRDLLDKNLAALRSQLKSLIPFGNMISTEAAALLREILSHDSVNQVAKRRELKMQDCWENIVESFLSSYPVWGGQDWVPSTEECIEVRVKPLAGDREAVKEIKSFANISKHLSATKKRASGAEVILT